MAYLVTSTARAMIYIDKLDLQSVLYLTVISATLTVTEADNAISTLYHSFHSIAG